jgi:hypothetical protein
LSARIVFEELLQIILDVFKSVDKYGLLGAIVCLAIIGPRSLAEPWVLAGPSLASLLDFNTVAETRSAV